MLKLDIMLKRHHVFYNLHIAERIGIFSAIFVQYLLDVRDLMKDKLVDGKFFLISRQQIFIDTSIDFDKQEDVEANLTEYKIIETKAVKNSKDKFYYSLDDIRLEKIIGMKREEVYGLLEKPGQAKSLLPVQKKQEVISARQQTILDLKTDAAALISDPIVREYLFEWIDAVHAKKGGFLSYSAIKQGVSEINDFSNGDNKIKIELLKIAAKYSHRVFKWAIQDYQNKRVNKESREELIAKAKIIEATMEEY